MNEVATINQAASTLKDKIAERIRAQFVELIPDDTWAQMVEAEIHWYTTGKGRWPNGKATLSPLQDDIREALHEMGKAAIKQALNNTIWQRNHGPKGEVMASEAVEKIVRENAATVVAQVFGAVVQNAVENVKFQS